MMSGSGGGGFVIDLGTLAVVAVVVVAIAALAWMVLRR
jgi:hypothetical protein